MDSGQPFELSAVTMQDDWLHVRGTKHNWLLPAERERQKALQPAGTIIRKHPRHCENSTRNIRLENGEIRKVKIRLIRKFNGQTVL